jgi:hypothetical protein
MRKSLTLNHWPAQLTAWAKTLGVLAKVSADICRLFH